MLHLTKNIYVWRTIKPYGLAGLCISVILLLRLVPTVFSPSLNWGDEVFQTTELAHRLVFGTGIMTWEVAARIRSWLLPGALAGIMGLGRAVGAGPNFYLPAISFIGATLSLTPVMGVFIWCRNGFGFWAAMASAAVPALAPELIYFSARPMSEVVAGHLLIAGIFLTTCRRSDMSGAAWLPVTAGMLLGVSFALRPQILPACIVLLLWPGVLGRWRVAAGAIAVVLAASILDWITLGAPSASIWRYALINTSGVSSHFGIESWYYYILLEIALWGPFLPVPIALCLIGAKQWPLPLICALAIIGAHMMIGHKEYRFIYPALVLLATEAGIGMAVIVKWATPRLADRWPRSGQNITGIAGVCIWASVSAIVWFSPNLTSLRARAHDTLRAADYAATLPDICGIGMGPGPDAWAPYGGYTHLHQDVPLFWPKNESAFVNEAIGFNLLLSGHSEPGFKVRKCFGAICVSQRPGRCQSLPQDSLPDPRSLDVVR